MISLDNYRLTFEASGGTIDINYTSDNPITDEAITSAPDWIETQIYKEDIQEGHITITVTRNDTHQRSATLEFTAYDRIMAREFSVEIEISQLPVQEVLGSIKIKSIEVDDKKVTSVNVDEHTHTIKVTLETSLISSVNVTSPSNWIKLYSQGENEYIFNISANQNSVLREATITFTATDILGNELTASVSVSQAAHYEIPVYFRVDDLSASSTEHVYTLNVEMRHLLNYKITDHPKWVEIQNSTATSLTVKVLANPTYKDREGKITYSAIDENSASYNFSSNVFQSRSIFTGQYPAWQDVFVPISRISDDESNITYSVSIMNNETGTYEVVYRGNAVFTDKDPEINITEIVRDYVEDNINISEDTKLTAEGLLDVSVTETEIGPGVGDHNTTKVGPNDPEVGPNDPIVGPNPPVVGPITPGDHILNLREGGYTQKSDLTKVMLNTGEEGDNLVASLYYYYDYSFDKDFKLTRNQPILNYFDVRQDIILSFLNLPGETNTVTIDAGPFILHLKFDTPGIFHNKRTYDEGNVIVNAPDRRTVLTSKNTCAKYAIYYLNPLGGWDQLLIEGKAVKTIKLENKFYKRNFDNNTNEFENKHYLKNLTTSYKLTTGYLTDAQAKLMPNLIETTKAYLCELDTKNYIPVLINNNSVDIKTYRNQGRKLFTYTIDVQESQNKFIK